MSYKKNGIAFQQHANFIGEQYEVAVVDFLVSHGWIINQRNARISFFEIDIVATDPNGRQVWMECKSGIEFSFNKNPGLARLDTVQKAIGKAFGLSFCIDRKPYWLVTSHLPNNGTAGDYLLKLAINAELVERIWHLKFDQEFSIVQENVKNENQLSFEL